MSTKGLHAVVSPSIDLQTRAGEFLTSHVLVEDLNGVPVREGAVLRSRVKVSPDEPVTVRVQSSCLFSESFWATDCDCALQLQRALRLIQERGGVVLYFYEEGRGVGLAKKFEAVRLQQVRRLNTRTAYECLKIDPDVRSYAAAAAVLERVLGKGRAVVLLSNNPEKEDGLRNHAINVVSRERLICGWDDPAIRAYLLEKKMALGHDIP